MSKKSITHDELNSLPLAGFKGDIFIVDDAEKMEQAYLELKDEKILGFDTETRPSFMKGKLNKMSLVQLSSEKKAYLLRINRTDLTEGIISLLENKGIIKVGASIRDDIRGIQKQFPFEPAGFVDIQNIASDYGITDMSLRKLSGIVLGIRISKAQRLSNWEAQSLTPAQCSYAATDAWTCREIFLKLQELNSDGRHKKYNS
ncbi:MAG: 3'-5' exonuclease domain-containing protein 2 [Rikenellaceae bacterium]|nr:3'-5' exonuclease domain-containing protein 2 [Rikenellaceae bacterium]